MRSGRFNYPSKAAETKFFGQLADRALVFSAAVDGKVAPTCLPFLHQMSQKL
jgi:hypothetical protein